MHRILRDISVYYTKHITYIYTYAHTYYNINIPVYVYTIVHYSTVMTFIVEALDIALVALSVPTSITTSPLVQ